MYIHPFIAGIFFTIIVEIIACLVYAAVSEHKKGDKK